MEPAEMRLEKKGKSEPLNADPLWLPWPDWGIANKHPRQRKNLGKFDFSKTWRWKDAEVGF
jgi:hypothetical protein